MVVRDDGGAQVDASTNPDGGNAAEGGVVINEDIAVAPALPDGQVVPPWDTFCVATFTQDFTVPGFFLNDAPLFDIQKGDRYLLAASNRPKIIVIADNAAADISLGLRSDDPVPFTSSCGRDTMAVVGIFADTTVYAEDSLTTPLCEVRAGQVIDGPLTYQSVGKGISVGAPGLAPICAGIGGGYTPYSSVAVPGDSPGVINSGFLDVLKPRN